MTTEAQKTIEKQQDALKHVEGKTVSGAPVRTPRAAMLDARPIEKANPDKYYRYANTSNVEKMALRKEDGYTTVSAEDAKKHGVRGRVGEMVLVEQNMDKHKARIADQRARDKSRLTAHVSEVEAVAEAVVKQLRDVHGLDVPIERLLVKE